MLQVLWRGIGEVFSEGLFVNFVCDRVKRAVWILNFYQTTFLPLFVRVLGLWLYLRWRRGQWKR